MNLTYDDSTVYIILFIVAFIASAIDAVAGGGGLLVVPTMLVLGMNPLTALGTNKLQSCFGTATSSINYYKNNLLKEKNIKLLFLLSFFGSCLGTLFVSQLSNKILNNIIPILLISAAIFLIFNKNTDKNTSNFIHVLFIPFILLIGFYDGFFGPGTGSFFVLSFIIIKGINIMEATAVTKLLNFSSNFAAFIIFAIQGYVIWFLGLTMAVAQIAGAYTGSRFAIKNGEKVVRPVLVIVSLLLSARILFG